MRQAAKTGFVNAVGRFSSIGAVVNKLAWWIDFSRWCAERRTRFGRYDTAASGRYEDRYGLYESVILQESLEEAPLDFLEFGVYEGASISWWARRISHASARFVGFDTFTGLPEKWFGWAVPGMFSAKGNIPEIGDPRCQFEVGLFQATLPEFLRRFCRRGRLIVHLDADLYSSTLFALTSIGPFLAPGDLLFFDEFADPSNEFRAFEDFARAYLLTSEVIGAVNNFNRVCLKVQQIGTLPEATKALRKAAGR
jgi:hypothetical protein